MVAESLDLKAQCPGCNPLETLNSSNFGNVQMCSGLSSSQCSELVLVVIPGVLILKVVLVIQLQVNHSTMFCNNKVQHIKRRYYRCYSLMVQYLKKEVLLNKISFIIEFTILLIILPDAKNNSNLLEIDFLQKVRIVLNLAENKWNFSDKSLRKYIFIYRPKKLEDTHCY